jgi:hypothetical protein
MDKSITKRNQYTQVFFNINFKNFPKCLSVFFVLLGMDGRIMKRVDSGFFILGRSLPPTCLLVNIVVVGGT